MDNIKAIFLDFDWTLFDHKTRCFNERGVEALNEAHGKGIKLIIDSARSYYSLKGLGTFELLPIDGFVVSNGGAAFTREKTLYADFIPDQAKDGFVALLERLGLGYNLITQHDTYIKEVDRALIDSFYQVYYEPYPLPISAYRGERVLAIQVFTLEKEDSVLKREAEHLGLLYNRFAENNVELTAREFLKSKGVKTMYDYLGLKKDEAMAFGDDLNDIPMFGMVKYGICLGNGKEEAKAKAYYVTDTIENDGLAKALVHFGIIED